MELWNEIRSSWCWKCYGVQWLCAMIEGLADVQRGAVPFAGKRLAEVDQRLGNLVAKLLVCLLANGILNNSIGPHFVAPLLARPCFGGVHQGGPNPGLAIFFIHPPPFDIPNAIGAASFGVAADGNLDKPRQPPRFRFADEDGTRLGWGKVIGKAVYDVGSVLLRPQCFAHAKPLHDVVRLQLSNGHGQI